MVFDGKVERSVVVAQEASADDGCEAAAPTRFYRAVEPLVATAGLMRSPCGGCPVARDCSESAVNPVNPVKCAYIKQWLTS